MLGVSVDGDGIVRRAALDDALVTRRIDIEDEPFVADLLMVSQRQGSLYEAMDNTARHRGKIRALTTAIERSAMNRPCVR